MIILNSISLFGHRIVVRLSMFPVSIRHFSCKNNNNNNNISIPQKVLLVSLKLFIEKTLDPKAKQNKWMLL